VFEEATEYPWIGGRLVSTDGVEHAERDYRKMTNEYVDKDNTSKWCRLSRPSFAVGALARFNNNYKLLHPEAAQAAASFGLAPVCHNPFMNNVAQLVECVHVTHDAIRLIDEVRYFRRALTAAEVQAAYEAGKVVAVDCAPPPAGATGVELASPPSPSPPFLRSANASLFHSNSRLICLRA
jgi:coenzyme F420-reducing hydrogenase alpha subunit